MSADVNEPITVRIEVPRGAFIKRGATGDIDFISPLPCPFNYGSVVGTTAPDGDPEDAVVLGPTLRYGDVVRAVPQARVRFIDEGEDDTKLICAARPLRRYEQRAVVLFFIAYGAGKGVYDRARGKPRPTRYAGFETL